MAASKMKENGLKKWGWCWFLSNPECTFVQPISGIHVTEITWDLIHVWAVIKTNEVDCLLDHHFTHKMSLAGGETKTYICPINGQMTARPLQFNYFSKSNKSLPYVQLHVGATYFYSSNQLVHCNTMQEGAGGKSRCWESIGNINHSSYEFAAEHVPCEFKLLQSRCWRKLEGQNANRWTNL